MHFNIKRGWRFLSNFDIGHCPVFSSQVVIINVLKRTTAFYCQN
ncbi:hypothetical protein CKO_04528 [Citrobacter koseri ATCC BAA-895]|uniref:Uncharacterized protein n=1 Tax=Citrobacter koseri (strain ATCC BAA-895 / CDC 4225-83 / SGSC4696) TaxID=290338 RepID=A8AQ18_CITK8|nr:hypothetical protein CKO_04528 [Citrobacter koseri ATCC BAA-895]